MNILPTIVQETVSQCKKQGFVVSAALASFFLKSQLLTSKKDAQNNIELTPEHVERLVNAAVRTLTLADSPMLETFKLQASLTSTQQEQLHHFRTEKVQHKAKSHRLMEDIWQKRDPNEVFGDITLFILHESRQLASASEAVQKETMLALEGVFPKALMDTFVGQREAEKVRQLEEIWRIVWGMRIFNKESGKPAAGIPDLLRECTTILEGTTDAAITFLENMQLLTKEYAAVLSSPSLQLSDTVRLRLQDEYLNRLQLKVYLRSLLQTVSALRAKVDEFQPTYAAVVEDANALVNGPDAGNVPKSAIYPRFISLSERWDVLYGLHREALDTRAILDLIIAYRSSFTPTLRDTDVEHALTGLAEERRPNRDLIATEISNPAVEYIADLPQDKRDARLEFNGFCVVSLMETGVLLDSKTDDDTSPGYLLLQANGAYYSFSSERALKNFARNPFNFLSQKLMDVVQSNAVLIYLLGLHPYLPKELYLAGSRKQEVVRVIEKGDGATQTGQIDSFKDTHYVWNEWDLRRLALQLAGLRTKRTKSSQTVLSHFRRDNDTQAFPPKEQTTQTMVDSAVQPPRVARYIKGLRGTKSSQLEVVEKTFLY